MKCSFAVILMLLIYPTNSREQSLQSVMSVDSQTGYSTNPYLNSWVGIWDASLKGAYWLIAPDFQANWYKNGNSATGSAGGFYQPYIGTGNYAFGGFTYLRFQRNFSYHWQANMSTGGQFVSGRVGRRMAWIQSQVNWFMSPLSKLMLNLGSSFWKYTGFTPGHFDSYGLQFESWPWYHWQIKASVFGDLDHIAKPAKNFTTQVGVTHLWNNGSQISSSLSVGQFKNVTTIIPGQTGGSSIPVTTSTEEVKNRLYIIRVQGQYPLTNRWSVNGGLAFSSWATTVTASAKNDFQTSVGVRWYLYPKFGRPKNNIKPQWYQRGTLLYFELHYAGNGRIFLVGDFDNWSKPGKPLLKQSANTYAAVLKLKPGVYEYKVLEISGSDMRWLKLARDVSTISDGFGGVNGRFIVDMGVK